MILARVSSPRILLFLLILPAQLIFTSCPPGCNPCPIGTVQLSYGCAWPNDVTFLPQPVWGFRNIPFGQDTGGDNRFMPPQPIDESTWNGFLNPPEIPPVTLSEDLIALFAGKVMPTTDCAQVFPYKIGGKDLHIGTEDCLKINVWTPVRTLDSLFAPNLPVMVFIYGGGFDWGGTSELFYPIYDGGKMAALNDVVVVTFNYRLGALANITDLLSPNKGNLAILDQMLALNWVQKNIASFGGDPEKVTIFGESAGAISVAAHAISVPYPFLGDVPFQSAIVESNPFALPFPTIEKKLEISSDYLGLLGCSDVTCAQSQSLEAILNAQTELTDGTVLLDPSGYWPDLTDVYFWTPTVDGFWLWEAPLSNSNCSLWNQFGYSQTGILPP